MVFVRMEKLLVVFSILHIEIYSGGGGSVSHKVFSNTVSGNAETFGGGGVGEDVKHILQEVQTH